MNNDVRTLFQRQIYGITSVQHSRGRTNEQVVTQMLKAGVRIIQYREKERSKREKYEECVRLRRVTREYHAVLIINDDIDIALAVGADGVHVGQQDMPLAVVRTLVGPACIIGVSTHSPDQACAARDGGADYIGVGPIYPTKTKTDVCAPVGLGYLDYVAAHIDLPCVAIGGIKLATIAEVVSHGAACVALVTEIVAADDISRTVAMIRRHL